MSRNSLFPLKELEYEQSIWPVPGNTSDFLEAQYGYIGENAFYNPKTYRYEKSN